MCRTLSPEGLVPLKHGYLLRALLGSFLTPQPLRLKPFPTAIPRPISPYLFISLTPHSSLSALSPSYPPFFHSPFLETTSFSLSPSAHQSSPQPAHHSFTLYPPQVTFLSTPSASPGPFLPFSSLPHPIRVLSGTSHALIFLRDTLIGLSSPFQETHGTLSPLKRYCPATFTVYWIRLSVSCQTLKGRDVWSTCLWLAPDVSHGALLRATWPFVPQVPVSPETGGLANSEG